MNPLNEWIWLVIVAVPVLAYLAWQWVTSDLEQD